MMNDSSDHPAIRAHLLSIEAAERGDKSAWLSLFAEDAQVQDPVGPSPHDPGGHGFQGKAAIAGFWDQVIGPANTTFHSQLRIPSGPSSCACHMTATNQIGAHALHIEMVVTYHLNEAGEIAALRAYWDVEAVMRAFRGAAQ